ncbi:hypothetical protein HYDPIDRAFT_151450 [Hydnomerulius pinastri MD-312]|nr:hypothetical protein HYDPIDRAFT_151450 [Hydnomerulius pinastri MD-312]
MSNAVLQNAFYVGNAFNFILYGVELVLYFNTMQILLKNRGSARQKSDRFMIIFSSAVLFLITIYVATESILGQEMWIVNADYPGGSAAYLAAYASAWYQTMGTASGIILQLMSDGLLIYRCLVVWNDRRILIFPCFLWIAALGLGITQLYVDGAPNGNFFVGLAAQIGVAYTATSVGLNIVLTMLICGRIIHHGRQTRTFMGAAAAEMYFGIVSIIIESAIPYSLTGIAFVVAYALNSDMTIFFLSLYVMFTALSPQMLMLRVASGRAWSRETGTQTTTGVQFRRPYSERATGVSQGDSNGTTVVLSDMRSFGSSYDTSVGKV